MRKWAASYTQGRNANKLIQHISAREANANDDESKGEDDISQKMRMQKIGLTSKMAPRGRIRVESLTKTFEPRKIAAFFEQTTSLDDLQTFKRLSVLLEAHLNDCSSTAYV